MKKLVSVNILTYNGEDLIENCLNSVLKQTYENIEILVIDNASKDNSVKIIKNWKLKIENFKFIKNLRNLGYTGGHNIGIKKSKGDYILCLNQDVVLDKDFIKYVVEAMEKNEKIGAIQARLLKPNSNIIDSTGLLIFKNRRVIDRGAGERNKNQYKSGYIFGANGAAPLYRRKALEDVKINNEYFDEDLFMYKEDIDMAWRMQLYGWRAIYEPRAIAYHLRSAGEKAVTNYISVAKQRRKLSQFAKFYSFKNDRLIRIKNELPSLFLKHILYIIIKEIGAWLYVLFFEPYTWKAIKSLISQIPSAWKKREIIMKNKRATAKEMGKWFN